MTAGPDSETSSILKPVYVGSRSHQYVRMKDWGIPTGDFEFGKITAVAVDSRDRVYVYQRDINDRGVPPIVVLNSDGGFVDSWGRGVVSDAHGLYITKADELFAVDRDGHQIVKFTPAGDVLMVLGGRPMWQAPFNHPNDLAVAPDGDLYVADGYCNSCVHHFSPSGEFIGSWGRPGSGEGEFRVPHGIWVDETDRVYVADRENNRVQIFDRVGQYVEAWADFYRPTDVFVDTAGHIFVTDLIPRVSVFDVSGRLVARLRPANNNAHGVWADSHGDLYVAATDGRNVEKFVKAMDAAPTDGA